MTKGLRVRLPPLAPLLLFAKVRFCDILKCIRRGHVNSKMISELLALLFLTHSNSFMLPVREEPDMNVGIISEVSYTASSILNDCEIRPIDFYSSTEVARSL